MFKIWQPKTPSEHAPRIRLDKIVATKWQHNGTTHNLRVMLEGSDHYVDLTASEGNELLDAWERAQTN